MAENPIATKKKAQEKGQERGLPLWMPMLGLVLAFLFAVFIGARICPTLYSIVLPPDPRRAQVKTSGRAPGRQCG